MKYKKKLIQTLVISIAVFLCFTMTTAAQASHTFNIYNGYTHDSTVFPSGACVKEYMWAWIDAQRSGQDNVYVKEYRFMLWHYQFETPTVWRFPGIGQELITLQVTFSGDGITTQTIDIVSGGSWQENNIPAWMNAHPLISGDPKGAEITATLPVGATFPGIAGATMTVHAVGYANLIVPWPPFYIPFYYFDITNEVSCFAWIGEA